MNGHASRLLDLARRSQQARGVAPTPARKPMTSLDAARTERHASFRSGRREVWGAVSACGRWSYRRLEDVGTPWIVLDAAGEEWGTGFGTLARARRATARHDAKETAQ